MTAAVGVALFTGLFVGALLAAGWAFSVVDRAPAGRRTLDALERVVLGVNREQP